MKQPDTKELLKSFSLIKDNPKVIVGIVAVVLLLDIGVVLRGQFVSLGRMFDQARKLKTSIKTTKEDIIFFSTHKNKLPDLESELADLNRKVISDQDLQTVMETISKYADTSSVRILNIRPEADTSAEQKKGAGSKQGDVFIRQKIFINAKCGFHQLCRFVGLLESSPPFLDIKNVEIRTDDQEYLKQSVTILLEVVLRKT